MINAVEFFLNVTVDCRELALSRNTSIKRLSHGWWTQFKLKKKHLVRHLYHDMLMFRHGEYENLPRWNWEIMQPIEIGIYNLSAALA